ncbi:TetR/AcrR family transcriptional regulator [Cryptosporangium japonicum]|uniref:TetR/AcrR family transcriptional regulator n=1 Tax=Cryptosporangium japonicum TaxID=80872 RepID=A0ABN0UGY5_9ACTN
MSDGEIPFVTIEQHPSGLVTWRERKKQATREALADAAWKLACEVGPENVRVDDIAAAAGVSARTFNNYYSSREEAIFAQRIRWAEEFFHRASRARPADAPLHDVIAGALLEVHEGRSPDKATIRLIAATPTMQSEYLRHSVMTEFALAEIVAQRTGCDQLSARVVGGAYALAIRAASEYWLRDDSDLPLTDFLRTALDRVAPAARDLEASVRASHPHREAEPC